MNFLGVTAVVTCLAAFAFVHRNLRSQSVGLRWAVLGCCLVLSVPSVLCSLYYFHILPERVWFYEFRSIAASELLMVFVGAAGAAAATLLPRRLLIIPLLGAVGITVLPYLKPLIHPLDKSTLNDRWEGESCLQSTDSTCGPASVATIMKHLGIAVSEREIALAAHTSAGGTEAWYLARYLRSKGLKAHFDFRKRFSPSVGFPALVGVRTASFGHFIAVLEVRDGQVSYADPLSGLVHTSLEKFLRTYKFTGFHMVVEKP